jgi:ribonuclease P protein component
MRNPLPLRTDRDFSRVLDTGRRGRAGGLTVVVAAHPEPGAPSRLGMSVRTRARSAVARNRIKRRLRAAFVAGVPSGHDVIVKADDRAAEEEFQKLVISLVNAVSRAARR